MSEYIQGVYNYCDRWCEKCPLQVNCSVYQQTKASDSETNIKAIWNQVSNNFKDTISQLQQIADEYGIDLDQANDLDMEVKKPLVFKVEELAALYTTTMNSWIINNTEVILHQKDAIESLKRYAITIQSKTNRAISSWDDVSVMGEFMDEIQNDANGSAKVALVCINNSIASLESIRIDRPELTNEMLDIFILISNVRDEISRLFPRANEFKRPGFDS
jgi:RNAse (barnase) inhibitor barstar